MRLTVASEEIAQFDDEDAVLSLNALAEEFCNDIKHLDSYGPLVGRITTETLELALQFMEVTYVRDDEIHEKYPEIFRKFIRQKFYWNIG